jgi:CDP-glucose 4,6-dehydratase
MLLGKFGEMQYKEIFENTYRGKKVLLTGHTGFKGSWMLTWLHNLGAKVMGYALTPENDNDLYCLINGDTLCNSVIGDIRDKEKLVDTVLDFQPDFIFHLAAQPLVRRSYEMPLYTFEVNVNGTAHLLEAVRNLQKICIVVIITTDKVYENRESDYAYRETDKLGGYDPYSASKAAAEIVVSSYRNSFFNPADFNKHHKAIATARAGNVIGGGDRATDRIVPDIIRALEAGMPVVVRNPKAIRPWQHILESTGGYLLLAAKLKEDPVHYAGAWNFGPKNDDVLTVEQLVKMAIRIYGSGQSVSPHLTAQPHEALLLKLDITKAKQELNWHPKWQATEAIKQTMDWYKKAINTKPADLMLQQILQYQIE